MAEPFRLIECECPTCDGLGTFVPYDGHVITCSRCWGTGKIEVQRGPKDQDREVPDPADLGITRATDTRWVTDWYGEGEVFIP